MRTKCLVVVEIIVKGAVGDMLKVDTAVAGCGGGYEWREGSGGSDARWKLAD